MNHEPLVHVGIVEGPRIGYVHHGVAHEAVYAPGFSEVYIADGPFTLRDVVIGKQFHWEQREDQTFAGALRIKAIHDREGADGGGRLAAINEVPLETYLASVISSEMAATNNLELLKAHAIISRSWVLRQMARREQGAQSASPNSASASSPASPSAQPAQSASPSLAGPGADAVLTKIWDHDDHAHYDVCADDHCQRYQGLTRQVSPLVAEAIAATRGQVLVDADGGICDARFYKACGGHTERFSACWQDRDYPYLAPKADPYCAPDFIATLPGGMDGVMRQVLNDYDRSTVDYHDWTVDYSQDEITSLVERRLGLGLGQIQALEPVERGASGRIVRLRIVGSERSAVIGKELLVRRALSESHLKSSWFDAERTPDGRFRLHGHGWGHGVGLCQIGAAAMSIAGFSHADILAHYYNGARIERLYN